jgi:replicative DNA helicase
MKAMSDVDLSQPRLPPQNNEAEQCVLGAILLDKAAMARAEEILVEEDFYLTAHQKIFRAMLDLSGRDEPIDQITLTNHLRGLGHLESIGGAAYLAELVAVTPTAANVRYHCKIVKDKALLRSVLATSTEVLMRGYDGAESAEAILEFAEQSVFRIGQNKLGQGFYPLKEVIAESLGVVDALHKLGKSVTGVPTGFTELDDITAGLQPSDLVILAARPSMGKTSLALGMAVKAAIEHHQKVGIFSLEMSKQQLVLRMLSSHASVDSHKLRIGKLDKEEWWALAEAAGRLELAPIFIDDSGSLSVMQMRGKARRLMKEKGLDLLIVDYLQLMQGRQDAESRQQEISDISRSLKALAKELQVPILALSQLSRAVENRTDKRPILADLRESGAIEQDADVVIFIYRDEVYNPDSDEKGIAHIMVKKHRNGPTGEVKLTFLDKFAKFADFSDREET